MSDIPDAKASPPGSLVIHHAPETEMTPMGASARTENDEKLLDRDANARRSSQPDINDPVEEARTRTRSNAPQGAPDNLRTLQARTNVKDGFYVEDNTTYFWIKYEVPIWTCIAVVFICFFIGSMSAVLNMK